MERNGHDLAIHRDRDATKSEGRCGDDDPGNLSARR
jgi:hypothetical protein